MSKAKAEAPVGEVRTVSEGSGMSEGTWYPPKGEKLEGKTIEGYLTRAFAFADKASGNRRVAYAITPEDGGVAALVGERLCMRALRDVHLGSFVRLQFSKTQQELKGNRTAHQATIGVRDPAPGVKLGVLARDAILASLTSDDLDRQIAAGNAAPEGSGVVPF